MFFYNKTIVSRIKMNISNAFIDACKTCKLEEVNQIFKFNQSKITHNNIKTAFLYACLNNNLDVAKWLLQQNKNIDGININLIIDKACQKGYLKMAKLLYFHPSNPFIKINDNNFNIYFGYACENGYLEFAQWLYSIKPTIDVSAYHEYAFRNTCKNGNLDIAKWLLQIKPTINISVLDDYTFNATCTYGHLNVAKWLLEVKPTINIFSYNIFIYGFRNEHLNIAKWLQTIAPFKYIIKNNNLLKLDKININLLISLWILQKTGYINYTNANIIFIIQKFT